MPVQGFLPSMKLASNVAATGHDGPNVPSPSEKPFVLDFYQGLFKSSAIMVIPKDTLHCGLCPSPADLYPGRFSVRWLLDHANELEMVKLPWQKREAMRCQAWATKRAASAAAGAPAAGGDKSPVSSNHGLHAFPVSCLGPTYLVEKRATLGTTPSSCFGPSSANQGWC